jgi:hypothetical protein
MFRKTNVSRMGGQYPRLDGVPLGAEEKAGF